MMIIVAERTAIQIDESRSKYTSAAFLAANLFFCICDLANVDPMYAYALDWYITLYISAVQRAPKSADTDERIAAINETFTLVLYTNVGYSLFAKDMLLFSFLLATRVIIGDGRLSSVHLRFFLQGSAALELAMPNPCDPDDVWLDNQVFILYFTAQE